MQYTPETIRPGTVITSDWGNKIEQMFARLGNHMGVLNDASELPSVDSVAESDWYIVRNQRRIYLKRNGQWVTIGAVSYSDIEGIVPVEQLSGTYNIDITGNQATQTKLQNQCTINNVPFDGTQNITILQSTPNTLTFAQSGGAAPGATFDGSAQLTVSYQTVGAQPASHTHSEYLSRNGGSMNVTTVITNLNADLLDGYHANQFASATHNHDTTYVRKSTADTITVRHTFNPSTQGAPFLLGTNAQGQLVSGLNADLLDGYHANQFASSTHNHDGVYAPATHNHDSVYLKLSGGTVTGDITMSSSANLLSTGNTDFTVSSNGSITFDIDSNNDSTDYLRITAHNKATTLVYIHENGNVGIGTTSPGAKLDVAGTIRTSSQFISTVATGTAPLQVSSNTVVTNLNADLVDGYHANQFASATHNHDTSYVRKSTADTITARHTFNPSSAGAPFVLGANAQGQLVTGLNADQLDGYHATQFATAGHEHNTLYVKINTADTITARHTFNPSSPGAPFNLGANASGQLVTGLNADLLDGKHLTDFAPAEHNHDSSYVRKSTADTITAQHTFNPTTTGAPFLLGANAAGQLVSGLNADLLDGKHASDFALAGHNHDSSYVRKSTADTITARHTFNPPTTGAPFLLGTNAQGQLVSGLNADLLDGNHANQFAPATHNHDTVYVKKTGDTVTGTLTMNAVLNCNATNGRLVLPVGTDKYAT